MQKNSINHYADQQRRLKIKNIHQQMMNCAVEGTGLSPWEAQVLVNMIEEVYFSEPELNQFNAGQMRYRCVSNSEGAGKPLIKCEIVTVLLTLFDESDEGNFSTASTKDRSVELRQRRLCRVTEEAKEQGGYLTQEDLAKILMCDVRTIRRDTKELKARGIILPTRGQQKDIGPGLSHRALAIRHWLEGKEPISIAEHIKHSIKAVENYLQKFKRVAFLKGRKMNDFEIALTIGISVSAAKTFSELYYEFKEKPFFKRRLQEIELIGGQYWQAQDEKKRSVQLKNSMKNEWRKR